MPDRRADDRRGAIPRFSSRATPCCCATPRSSISSISARISLPLPREGGLPTGLMLVARNGHDQRLLRIAAAVEHAACLELAQSSPAARGGARRRTSPSAIAFMLRGQRLGPRQKRLAVAGEPQARDGGRRRTRAGVASGRAAPAGAAGAPAAPARCPRSRRVRLATGRRLAPITTSTENCAGLMIDAGKLADEVLEHPDLQRGARNSRAGR